MARLPCCSHAGAAAIGELTSPSQLAFSLCSFPGCFRHPSASSSPRPLTSPSLLWSFWPDDHRARNGLGRQCRCSSAWYSSSRQGCPLIISERLPPLLALLPPRLCGISFYPSALGCSSSRRIRSARIHACCYV